MSKILLVEDDITIIENLSEYLRTEGFAVDNATGQNSALSMLEESSYDLILLDICLSDGNGFVVCSAAKARYSIPIIFLTASGDEFSVITGLEMGADDYISKPFRPRELVLRIKNALRKNDKHGNIIEYLGLVIDMSRAAVTKNGNEVLLTALEYKLLVFFMTNRGVILQREKLFEAIWDISGEFVSDNTLTVYIKRLREKIEDDPQHPLIIKTVRGIGYIAGENT